MATSAPQSTIQKWRNLADLVISLTSRGILKWEESLTDNEYITSIEGASIAIRKITRTTEALVEQPFVEVAIHDSNGKEVDSFTDEDIETTNFEYFRKLDETVRQIHRGVSGAEEKLDKILLALRKKDPDDLPF